MLLTVLFGEFLAIMILVTLLQIVHIKWLHIVLYLLLFISFSGVTYYAFNPTKFQVTSSWPFIEKIDTVKADYNDKKTQLSSSEFKPSEEDYDFVTYKELHENNSLYDGKLIDQWGKVKKVIANDKVGRKLVVDLDESHKTDTVIVNYHLSDLARGLTNVKENDRVKIFGEGASINKDHVPVIDAHFINLN